MNVVLWLLAGGAIGWIACANWKLNQHRGLVVSALIGTGGAFFGGHVLAPVLGTGVDADGFAPLALIVASASALFLLTLSDMMYERFDV